MKWLLTALALALVACAPEAKVLDDPITKKIESGLSSGDAEFDHSAFHELLQEVVDYEAGRVDYRSLNEQRVKLDSYLTSIAQANLTELNRDEQLALFINAYNGYTLKLILENYPVESIKNIDNPWGTKRYKVAGHELSLDNIEHNIIRPIYLDERIHFAVNCAAIGCPALADFAFVGPRIDEQLDEVSKRAMSNERYARVKGQTLYLTKILDWYGSDFTDDAYQGARKTVAQWVAQHSTPQIKKVVDAANGDPNVSFVDYDWRLNDVDR